MSYEVRFRFPGAAEPVFINRVETLEAHLFTDVTPGAERVIAFQPTDDNEGIGIFDIPDKDLVEGRTAFDVRAHCGIENYLGMLSCGGTTELPFQPHPNLPHGHLVITHLLDPYTPTN